MIINVTKWNNICSCFSNYALLNMFKSDTIILDAY